MKTVTELLRRNTSLNAMADDIMVIFTFYQRISQHSKSLAKSTIYITVK